MLFFIVTMTHPDGDGWARHAAAHVDYLRRLVVDGTLKASGPLRGTAHRAGFLIVKAKSRRAVEALVDADPFAIAGLIDTLAIEEWDPLFGVFSPESSGRLAGLGVVG